MGNSEGSHGRSHSHTASPQHSSTTVPNERVKRHARHKSAVVSSLVDQNDETYYTCKTSLSGTGQNGNGDPPSTYFYQLPTVRGAHSQTLAGPISRRVDKIDFSVPQPQTHAAVSQQQPRLARMQSQTQNVSTQQPIKVTVVQQETIGKDLLDTEHVSLTFLFVY